MSELLGGRVNEAGYAAYLLRLRGSTTPSRPPAARTTTTRSSAPCTTRTSSGSPPSTPTSTTGRPAAPARSTPPPPRRTPTGSRTAAAEWGGLYVAHHYTRYLGDLSGGQAIGRILDRDFDLGGRGISFYSFESVPKPKPYKDAYRARLDALGTTPAGEGAHRRRGPGRLPAQPRAVRRALRAAGLLPPLIRLAGRGGRQRPLSPRSTAGGGAQRRLEPPQPAHRTRPRGRARRDPPRVRTSRQAR